MKRRTLGQQSLEVSSIGLGCMGMSFAYGGASEIEATRTIHEAIDLGMTFLDTAEVYGPFENEELLGRALKGRRTNVQIATKFGFNILDKGTGVERMAGVDSRPEHIRDVVSASLSRLKIETIDLLYQHRVDPNVPIEDVVGTMADLVREGKVRHLGLCEISASTLRQAHAVHPITAVQSEYSLWSRDPESEILSVCRELCIGFVPYSPLGRGFLTGALEAQQLAPDDFRRGLPRFQEPSLTNNNLLLAEFKAFAENKHCSPAQLALAWILHKGDFIVPIPGVRRLDHLRDNANALEVSLSATDIKTIESIFDTTRISGQRYTSADLSLVDG